MSAPRAAAILLLALTGGCSGGPPAGAPLPHPVPIEGPPGDILRLAGEWTGEFVNRFGGRTGSITFTLEAGRDTAYGWVLTRDAPPAAGCTDAIPGAVQPGPGGPTVLRLGRVVVADGSVAGWLQSYADFELGCPVDTWFEGRLQGDTLSGMFFAHPASGDTVRQGSWWAARKRW